MFITIFYSWLLFLLFHENLLHPYLIGYLERVRATIPNYMLRAALGLRNSSNRGEKANDRIVSNRQKHNGMSWSDTGSTTLASVSALQYNNELDNWVSGGTLSLNMVERTTPRRPRRNRKRTETSYSNNKSTTKRTYKSRKKADVVDAGAA